MKERGNIKFSPIIPCLSKQGELILDLDGNIRGIVKTQRISLKELNEMYPNRKGHVCQKTDTAQPQ